MSSMMMTSQMAIVPSACTSCVPCGGGASGFTLAAAQVRLAKNKQVRLAKEKQLKKTQAASRKGKCKVASMSESEGSDEPPQPKRRRLAICKCLAKASSPTDGMKLFCFLLIDLLPCNSLSLLVWHRFSVGSQTSQI